MVQGTGQADLTNKGDGFVTDPSVLARNSSMSDPNLFFEQLIAAAYVRQVSLLLICCTSLTAGMRDTQVWHHAQDRLDPHDCCLVLETRSTYA